MNNLLAGITDLAFCLLIFAFYPAMLAGIMATRRRFQRADAQYFTIPAKANRVLHLVLIAMVLLLVRVWHLTVIQHDKKVEESRRPTRHVVVEPARRATIRDRYNIPMAINKMQYNAAISYADIRRVPSTVWETDASGKRVKRYKRREYITALSQFLGEELNMDPKRIEDLIHAKASFHDHMPFVLKQDIQEKAYYRLKMLERDWPGLEAQRVPRRYYPKGSIGSDIIGFMGAIDRKEYDALIQERRALQEYVQQSDAGEDPALLEGFESGLAVRERLKDLEERAYTINDFVGKTGIESRFEEDLRGFYGKKLYYTDSKGNYVRELPGSRDPLPGKRLLLSISSELQEYAEELLTRNERIRKPRLSKPYLAQEMPKTTQEPWIKGGAIVALDPHTGEVLAMASYPRIDPNDFIPSGDKVLDQQKRDRIHRWFETEGYVGEIWDGRRPLERELYDSSKGGFYEEAIPLTWEKYLSVVVPEEGNVHKVVNNLGTVRKAIALQDGVEQLLALAGEDNLAIVLNLLYDKGNHQAFGGQVRGQIRQKVQDNISSNKEAFEQLKRKLDPVFSELPYNYDKLLVVDLARIAVPAHLFSQEAAAAAGSQSLSAYREATQAMMVVNDALYQAVRELFGKVTFVGWREANQTEFLKQKRLEEKQEHRHAKPYIDYLDAKEKELFADFWQKYKWDLISTLLIGRPTQVFTADEDAVLDPYWTLLSSWKDQHAPHKQLLQLQGILKGMDSKVAVDYLKTLRGFTDLTRPLYGRYKGVRKENGKQLEKHLAAAFYPVLGYGYGRSQAYRQAAVQGSIFKIVVAYEALATRFRELQGTGRELANINPLEFIDQTQKIGKSWNIGYTLQGAAIPQAHKGGLLPRSLSPNIGRIDMVKAIEVSSNPYFALLASDVIASPEELVRAATDFSYGSKTGIDLPGEISGKIPTDLDTNRTGLYYMAIGQHSLVVTPLQTAVMLSAIANGGKVLKPQLVKFIAGASPARYSELESDGAFFPYQDSLLTLGIDFPLFVGLPQSKHSSDVQPMSSALQRTIFMPNKVRSILLEGMGKVALRYQTQGLESLKTIYRSQPEAVDALTKMKGQMVGKTGTGESTERLGVDRQTGGLTYNQVWFGSIFFDPESPFKDGETFVYNDHLGRPELVVVCFLRYGGVGREVAPLAALMANKWREIRKKHQ